MQDINVGSVGGSDANYPEKLILSKAVTTNSLCALWNEAGKMFERPELLLGAYYKFVVYEMPEGANWPYTECFLQIAVSGDDLVAWQHYGKPGDSVRSELFSLTELIQFLHKSKR